MMTAPTIANVHPVNPIEEPWKVDLLAQSYRAREEVTPIVVLRCCGVALHALSGSHRLAALARVFGRAMPLDRAIELGYALVFDAPAIPAVDALRAGRMDYAGMVAIVDALPACADAMEDQL